MSEPVLVALLSGVVAVVNLVVLCAVAVAAAVDRNHTRAMVRPAMVLVGLSVLLQVPGLVAAALWFDPAAALPPGGLDADALAIVALVSRLFVIGGGCAGVVLGAVLLVFQVAVADKGAGRLAAFPLLTGAPGSLMGWPVALAFGGVTGVVSVVLFHVLDIGVSQTMAELLALFPGMPDTALFSLAVGLPSLLAAALGEEVLIRGVAQRWLTRWLGGGTLAVFVAIVVSTGFWALMHLGNTDAVLLKLSQIFLIGLGLGGIAHRWGVESAIVGHMSLNATVILGTVALASF